MSSSLYSEVHGSGVPLLMIAGVASDVCSWVFQRDVLAARFQTILFDHRGVGRSPIPAGPYSVEGMVEDVVSLLDALRIEQAHVVGHSLGGAVAQQLAARHPGRVKRLVLACSFARVSPRIAAVLESWSGCVALGASPEQVGHCFFPWLYTDGFFAAPGNLAQAVEALRGHAHPLSATGLAGQVAATVAYDGRRTLGRIQATTLVLGAEQDALVSLAACQELAEAIPGARLQILAGTGHACMIETPQLFSEALVSFLAQ